MRPQATGGRAAGAFINAGRPFVLTSATAVGSELVVDIVLHKRARPSGFPKSKNTATCPGLRLSGHCHFRAVVLARDPSSRSASGSMNSTRCARTRSVPFASLRPDQRWATGVLTAIGNHPRLALDMLWLYAAGSVRFGWSMSSAQSRRIGHSAKGERRSTAITASRRCIRRTSREDEAGEPGRYSLCHASLTRQDLALCGNADRGACVFSRSYPKPDWLPTKTSDWGCTRTPIFEGQPARQGAQRLLRSGLDSRPDDPRNSAWAMRQPCFRTGEKVSKLAKLVQDALRRPPQSAGLAELADVDAPSSANPPGPSS